MKRNDKVNLYIPSTFINVKQIESTEYLEMKFDNFILENINGYFYGGDNEKFRQIIVNKFNCEAKSEETIFVEKMIEDIKTKTDVTFSHYDLKRMLKHYTITPK